MPEYLRIKNVGQICRVVGRNAHGGVILKNPNSGRNELFHPSAVESVQHGQYLHCWMCRAPLLISVAHPHAHPVCSDYCLSELQEHYK